MHFPFSLNQIFWTLTFAAQLTLLVVLMGRERIRRFPFFTLSIALYALRLMAEVLLSGRMAMIPYQKTMLVLSDLIVLAGLLLVAELARLAFQKASIKQRAVGAFVVVLLAALPTILLGSWPSLKGVPLSSPMAVLTLMQLFAQKANLFYDVLVIAVCILALIFGTRLGEGRRSHTRRILLGLAVMAFYELSIQIVGLVLSLRWHPQSQAEYEQVMQYWVWLLNVHKALYVGVLALWILSLWKDESGAAPLKEAVSAVDVDSAPVADCLEAPAVVSALVESAVEPVSTLPPPTE